MENNNNTSGGLFGGIGGMGGMGTSNNLQVIINIKLLSFTLNDYFCYEVVYFDFGNC